MSWNALLALIALILAVLVLLGVMSSTLAFAIAIICLALAHLLPGLITWRT
jgi:hypothetical protein